MSALNLPLVFEALSRVCGDVASVDVVHGVNIGTAQNPIVRPLSDEAPVSPAIILVPGAWAIIAGAGHARFTFTAIGTIFHPRQPGAMGEAAVRLMEIFGDLFDAFAIHSKAYNPDPTLQSVTLTEGAGLSEAEWPLNSDEWHLTWPFELEVKVNVITQYQAQ